VKGKIKTTIPWQHFKTSLENNRTGRTNQVAGSLKKALLNAQEN
jgi:translation initiation factor IF-1